MASHKIEDSDAHTTEMIEVGPFTRAMQRLQNLNAIKIENEPGTRRKMANLAPDSKAL